MRSRTAKAATLGPVDIKATTGEGAPSYTSGVQTWKGAAETLKPRPISTMATASQAKPGVGLLGRAAATSVMLVVPVAPKVRAMPYKKKAVAKEPSKKYLSPASGLLPVRLRMAARM